MHSFLCHTKSGSTILFDSSMFSYAQRETVKKRESGSVRFGVDAPNLTEQKSEFHSAEGLCLKKSLPQFKQISRIWYQQANDALDSFFKTDE